MVLFKRTRARNYHQRQDVRRYVALGGAAVLLLLFIILLVGKQNADRALAGNREIMAVGVQSNVNQALRQFDGFERRSSDDIPELFTQMRRYLYAASALNRALVQSYGETYSVYGGDSFDAVVRIMDEYELILSSGKSVESIRATLVQHMGEMETALSARFASDGLVLPKTASQTPGQ